MIRAKRSRGFLNKAAGELAHVYEADGSILLSGESKIYKTTATFVSAALTELFLNRFPGFTAQI